jgi:hypothetical protein
VFSPTTSCSSPLQGRGFQQTSCHTERPAPLATGIGTGVA